MTLRRSLSTLAILCSGAFLGSCETVPSGNEAARPSLAWSVSSRPSDDTSLLNDVFLKVGGETHLIDRDVMSLKGAEDSGNLSSQELRRLNAVSGYFLDWHVSGVSYFARWESGAVVVYAEVWGDENEGASHTQKLKTIQL